MLLLIYYRYIIIVLNYTPNNLLNLFLLFYAWTQWQGPLTAMVPITHILFCEHENTATIKLNFKSIKKKFEIIIVLKCIMYVETNESFFCHKTFFF